MGNINDLNSDVDSRFLYTDPVTQKSYPAWMVTAVDELIYKIRHKNIWEIVDFCISIWAKKYPQEHKRFLKEMAEHRKSRLKETAATKSNTWRELVIAPQEITLLLNKLASHKIRDYGEHKFWRDFAKKYPGFRVGEKL